jgi:hypothetical protein
LTQGLTSCRQSEKVRFPGTEEDLRVRFGNAIFAPVIVSPDHEDLKAATFTDVQHRSYWDHQDPGTFPLTREGSRSLIDGFYHAIKAFGLIQRVHLVFAYVPVGLVTGAVFFSLGAYTWKKNELRVSASHAVLLAFIFVFPSVLFGVFDWMYFYEARMSFAVKMKMALSLALILFLAGAIILRGEEKIRPVVRFILYVSAW